MKINELWKVEKNIFETYMYFINRAPFHFLCLFRIQEIEFWWVLLLQLQWKMFLYWEQIGCSMAICWIFKCIAMALRCLSTASEYYLAHTMLQVNFLILLYVIWNISFEEWRCKVSHMYYDPLLLVAWRPNIVTKS